MRRLLRKIVFKYILLVVTENDCAMGKIDTI